MNVDLDKYFENSFKSIDYFKCSMLGARSFNESLYFEDLMKREMSALSSLIEEMETVHKLTPSASMNTTQTKVPPAPTSNTFTKDELAKYNGKNGMPAYVAINGGVYDVSNEATWGGSTHFGLLAGSDLTDKFQDCHGNMYTLRNLPKVGTLK